MSFYDILLAKKLSGGGGGITPTGTINITQNGTVDVTQYAEANVNVPSGGSGVTPKDVNFIDYDGTVLYAYTVNEFNALPTMPENPSHDGLTAQGWNWSLAGAKAQLQAMPTAELYIGQMYTTDDGKTRIHIDIPRGLPQSRMQMVVCFKSSVADNVLIDWGDGTSETIGSTSTTSYSHTYSNSGEYVISLEVTSGSILFDFNNSFSVYGDINLKYLGTRIKRIHIGESVDFGTYSFQKVHSLEYITIPNTVTKMYTYLFYECDSLKAVVVPDSVSAISNYGFSVCSSLNVVSLPEGFKTLNQSLFSSCKKLENITLPYTITGSAQNVFNTCSELQKVCIPTGMTKIYSYMFGGCNCLEVVDIPDSVTTVEGYAFQNCNSLADVYVRPETPPTGSSSMFTNYPNDMVIHVPHGTLEAYQTASGWSTYASKMVEMPA